MANGTRSRLIEVAGDLFYSGGIQAVGLDRILQVVGITKTAFYKHFESKDDLVLAVLEHRDRREIAEALAYMRHHGADDPHAQILAFFDLLTEWFQRPDFRGCLFMNAATEFPSPTDPIHRAAVAHGQHIAAEMLLRVQAARLPRPDAVTKQLMLLVSGAVSTRHAGGAVDAAQTARQTAEVLLSTPQRAPHATLKPRAPGRAVARPSPRKSVSRSRVKRARRHG